MSEPQELELTVERKAGIDAMTYEQLLSANRFAPGGDIRFRGEHGRYWLARMYELRDQNPEAAVAASKSIGWEKK